MITVIWFFYKFGKSLRNNIKTGVGILAICDCEHSQRRRSRVERRSVDRWAQTAGWSQVCWGHRWEDPSVLVKCVTVSSAYIHHSPIQSYRISRSRLSAPASCFSIWGFPHFFQYFEKSKNIPRMEKCPIVELFSWTV